MKKVILYIAISLDGFIADKNGGVDWLSKYKDPNDEMGYKSLMRSIDTIIMGMRSYEQILTFGEWAWKDKQTFVFSSEPFISDVEYVQSTQFKPIDFVKALKEAGGDKDIWLLGGGELARSFAVDRLIDEIILTVIPTRLGNGISLNLNYDEFDLISQRKCQDNIYQKVYQRNLS